MQEKWSLKFLVVTFFKIKFECSEEQMKNYGWEENTWCEMSGIRSVCGDDVMKIGADGCV